MFTIKHLEHFFFALCTIVGIINIISGIAVLLFSYEINMQLSSGLVSINAGLNNSLAILSNVSILASSATANTHILSQNLSSILGNFSMNLNAIQQNFNQESSFFYNWSIFGYRPQTTQEIGNTFQMLSMQVSLINNNDIPAILHLVNTETSNIAVPISNISQQTRMLKYNLFTVLNSYRYEISQVQSVLLFVLVGLGIYTILQGMLFITLGKIITYLIKKSRFKK